MTSRSRALVLLAAVLGAGGCAGPAVRTAPAFPPRAPGKAALVDFWAPWCEACRESEPRLESLARTYGPRGLEVVRVNEDEDPGGRALAAYGARALPAAFLVDARGRVRRSWSGAAPGRGAEIEAAVEALLDEPAPPPAQ